MSDYDIEKTFAAGDHPALKLSNIAGMVTITGAPISEIRVEAHKHRDAHASQTVVKIEQQADGLVEIKVEPLLGPLSFLTSSKVCSVDFDIEVPHACRVDASVVSADLDASGLQGSISISGVSGELDLEDLQGDLAVTTVSGILQADRLVGTLNLSTVSGNVSLASSDLRTLKLSTVSGDVDLETAVHPEGHYRLSSVSGSVDWTVPYGTACRVKMSSISGMILADTSGAASTSGAARSSARAERRTLTLGEGGPEISLSTVSGDLHIRTALPDLQAV